MAIQTSRRLPGINFEVQSPPLTNVLPRMDVAIFVGFAASGPLHIPVAIEDVFHFTAIFGDDLPLAWDQRRGEIIYAYLAPAVRAFFRNGGRRCWVIRVARNARPNFFPIPCLAQARWNSTAKSWNIRPAFAPARSVGSWSDSLEAGSVLLSDSATSKDVKFTTDSVTGMQGVSVTLTAVSKITAGDLLQLAYHDQDSDYIFLSIVNTLQALTRQGSTLPTPTGFKQFQLTARNLILFRSGPPVKQPATIDHVQIFTHDASMDTTLPVLNQIPPAWDKKTNTFTLGLNVSFTDAPPAGTLIRIDYNTDQLWLIVQKIKLLNEKDAALPPSVEIEGAGFWLLNALPEKIPQQFQADVLSFELWARKIDADPIHISDLAFDAEHPRFWGSLPTDERVYTDTGIPTTNNYAALWQEATLKQFPFAGGSTGDSIFLPLAMPAIPTLFLGADKHPDIADSTPRPETALDRDGLSQFDDSLFLDPDLNDTHTADLMAQADYISYQSSQRRPLQGIHAALSIDEATIIAVPDAVHLGWTSIYEGGDPQDPNIPKPKPPAAQSPAPTFHNCAVAPAIPVPGLTQPQPKIQLGSYMLSWTAVGIDPQTVRYTLQESTDPDFAGAVVVYAGHDTSRTLYSRSPSDYYYRVNAQIDGIVSDWSNGVVVRVAPAVQWKYYTSKQYDDQSTTQEPILQAQRTLLQVQLALLRLCGARGDIFAVMALPAHYREETAIEHTQQLKSSFTPQTVVGAVDVDLLGLDEACAFSFGSLYHPWLIGRENSRLDELRQTPPDGAATGIMARRALTRGAWVAPANEVLSNVIALSPALARERWLDLQEAHLNIIRQEPRGFLYLSADTLSDDTELQPINVRRVLILLRRLALRLGADYVFEPNNDAFRRAVQRGFEAMLEQLFVRGAFAGNTASEAFQVVTKSYLNTPQSVEQGRFIVELKVAPSQPLTFLTIRLLQSNDGSLVTEG